MRKPAYLLIALICGASLSCSGRAVTSPPRTGQLEVWVHWQDESLAERRLEIIELELVRLTDADGLAVFTVPAGDYTLRALINVGGPSGSSDQAVTVPAGAATRVEVVDCLPCVSPG